MSIHENDSTLSKQWVFVINLMRESCVCCGGIAVFDTIKTNHRDTRVVNESAA